MPNYSLVANTSFNPFTYKDYAAPLEVLQKRHNEVEAMYDDLQSKAELLRQRALSATEDEKWAKTYLDYADRLQRGAEELYNKGVQGISRRKLLDLRKEYSSAVSTPQKAIEAQIGIANKRITDPSKRMEYGDMPTIDQLIADPTLTQVGYSGAVVEDSAMKLAAAAASRRHSNSFTNFNKYWMKKFERVGFNRNDISKFLKDAESIPELNDIISRVTDQFSGFEGLNTVQKERMAAEIMSGILKGATGSQKVDYVADQSALIRERNNNQGAGQEDEVGPQFAPRILEGAEGKVSSELKRLEGFRPSGNQSFTTNALHKAAVDVQKLEGELNGISEESKHDFYVHEAAVARANLANPTHPAVITPPSGYYEYKNIKNKLNAARKALKDEQKFVNNMIDKYKHLGSTDYDRVRMGMALEETQAKQELSSFVLNNKESAYNDVRHGIANILGSFTEEALNSGNVGLVDDKGNTLDYDEVMDIIDASNSNKGLSNLKVKIKGGVNPKLTLVYKGKEYTTKNIKQIDDYNRELSLVQSYLSDFSREAVSERIGIDRESLVKLVRGEVSTLDLNTIPSARLDKNHRGLVFYDPTSGEYVKIMTNNNGRIEAINTLSGELTGGENRDQYFTNMANKGLKDLIGLVAQ